MQIIIDTCKDSKDELIKLAKFLNEIADTESDKNKSINNINNDKNKEFSIPNPDAILGLNRVFNLDGIENNNNKSTNELEQHDSEIFIESASNIQKIQTLKEAIEDEDKDNKYKGIKVIPY
ncbi:MAG: hypothetical protein QXG00_04780 [Candidatus Woesearchaeota archaeon]